ncbi:MAG: hypothetical protein ACI4MV_07070 [Christensenellales bacterium]
MCKGVILNVIAVGHWQSQVLCHCEAFEKRCGNLVRFVVVAMYNQNSNVIAPSTFCVSEAVWRGNLKGVTSLRYVFVIASEGTCAVAWQSPIHLKPSMCKGVILNVIPVEHSGTWQSKPLCHCEPLAWQSQSTMSLRCVHFALAK